MTDRPGIMSRDPLDEALKALPPPTAPTTLLSRVMTAVSNWSGRPWYRRAWFTWPLGWRIATAVNLVLLLVGCVLLLPALEATASAALSHATAGLIARVTPSLGEAAIAQETGLLLWRTLVQPVAPYVLAVVTAVCVACAAIGAALNHVAFGGFPEP